MNKNIVKLLKTLIYNPSFESIFKYKFLSNQNLDSSKYSMICHNFSINLSTKQKLIVPNLFLENNDAELFKQFLQELEQSYDFSLKQEQKFKNLDKQNKDNAVIIKNTKMLGLRLINFFNDIQKRNKKILKKDKKNELKEQIQKLDLNKIHYEDFFPKARNLKRKITFFIGPTNSGKTYNAINELVKYKNGVYLAPLRLLALEGQDEIRSRGLDCSFITGEEKDIVPNAKFIAQTVETFNFNKEVDAILIDEIQMLEDKNRGWAWTQTIIGAPSKNIILTGSLDAKYIVQEIANLLGDELEIIELKRYTTLIPNSEPISIKNENDIAKLEEGTAIITFSRKNVLHFKSFFEKANIPVAIIYGNLSPEVRREEARKFREGICKYLISTDAIAMGLNLPIKQIIFAEVSKFNGEEVVELTASEARQIAGRAGRFGKYPEGYFTAMNRQDIKFLISKLGKLDIIPFKLYIKPSLEQVLSISDVMGTKNLLFILKKFEKITNTSGTKHYHCFDVDALTPVLNIIDSLDLSIEQKMFFIEIPLDYKNETVMNYFKSWIMDFINKKQIIPKNFFNYNDKTFNNNNLLAAENNIKLLTAYLWMSQRLNDFAPHKNMAIELKKKNNEYIIECLSKSIDSSKKCEVCNILLPINFIHKKCEACFNKHWDDDIYPIF